MRPASCTSRRALLALALSCGVFASFAPAGAQDASQPLKGETVRFYVGFSPGGGYDAYARMLAPHFEKATGATVVVENRPGGGGLTALNQLVRGKPDGAHHDDAQRRGAPSWRQLIEAGRRRLRHDQGGHARPRHRRAAPAARAARPARQPEGDRRQRPEAQILRHRPARQPRRLCRRACAKRCR